MTDITVVRGTGTHPGDDIHEPLLASDAAAVARGKAEIDDASMSSTIVLTCRYRSDIAVGDLVEVVDPTQGPAYRAQVIGISIQFSSNVDMAMTLKLWRPL